MVLWCYLATMTADPGGVPPGWHPFSLELDPGADLEAGGGHRADLAAALHDPLAALRLAGVFQRISDHAPAPPSGHAGYDDDSEEGDAAERTRWEMERPRWCRKCLGWKPPRAHHCSMGRRCVLKMDHYCVWVGTTVGLLNYKQFCLFLGYAWVGCTLSAGLLVRPCIAFFSARDPELRPLLLSFLAFVFTAAFALALLGFVIMHARLVAANQSTIEAYEKRPLSPWPYDRGARGNYREVFGDDPWRWLVPIVPPEQRRRLLAGCLDVAWALPPAAAWAPGEVARDAGLDPGRSSALDSRASMDSEVGLVLLERTQ